ncbi:MAG: hypothetical protein ACRYFX_04630 [Janthinobacterium lividum]
MIHLNFSYYWLLLPLAIILLLWIMRVASKDTGNVAYAGGIATLFAMVLAVVIFLVALTVLLLIDKFTA